MKRFTKVTQPSPNAFSGWIQPRMRKYLMACCDCNLVHEMQFQVHAGKLDKRGGQRLYVVMRARRAIGHTNRLRKRSGK